MRRRLLLFLLMASTLMTAAAYALQPPPRPAGYVHDQAVLMSPAARERLETYLALYEKQSTNQIVVATFDSLEEEPLEDFSVRLAEAWTVGERGKDNGVILLVIKKDQKIRIEVGYGLEGSLPDSLAGEIIRTAISPAFQAGRYDDGIFAGVTAIIQAVRGEFGSPVPAGPASGGGENADTILVSAVLGLAALISAVDLFRYGAYRAGHRGYAAKFGFWEWWFRFALLLFILNLLFRVIFYAMMTSRGGYYGGRGGFGGFRGGGGSFGGGGASGGW